MTDPAPSNAGDPLAGAPPAILEEARRQHARIMFGTAYGDTATRATMERELLVRLVTALRTETPLRVYLGVDPTAPDLHLGHCVALRKLRAFQDLGHVGILLIGDFTGRVGDPSDKDTSRPLRAEAELAANAQTYVDQAAKVLDIARAEIHRNSEWLGALTFADVVRLASNFTVAQFIERDNFRKRLDRGEPVYVHEFLYGLMQGYDAVALRADVQLGGTDQTFNIMAGRILQRVHGQEPQVAVTSPILVGLDGALRMSKSTGNYIGIDEPAEEQYGKAMSIPDGVIVEYFTLATNADPEEVRAIEEALNDNRLHPMEAKQRLARAVVEEWHGPAAATAAAEHFAAVFSRREAPDAMPEYALPFPGGVAHVVLADLLADAGLAASRGEAKRLLQGGGVSLDGTRLDSPEIDVRPGAVLKVGKRRWLRLVER